MAPQHFVPTSSLRGFTLIELLVAVTVLGVLLGVGVPNLFNLIEQSRLTTDANNLVVSLNYARSEAIRRNSLVSICPSADGSDCNSTTWTDGGIVFTDGGTLGDVDGTDIVLRVIPAVSVDIDLNANGPEYICFLPTGFLPLSDNGISPESLRIAETQARTWSAIVEKALAALSPIQSASAWGNNGGGNNGNWGNGNNGNGNGNWGNGNGNNGNGNNGNGNNGNGNNGNGNSGNGNSGNGNGNNGNNGNNGGSNSGGGTSGGSTNGGSTNGGSTNGGSTSGGSTSGGSTSGGSTSGGSTSGGSTSGGSTSGGSTSGGSTSGGNQGGGESSGGSDSSDGSTGSGSGSTSGSTSSGTTGVPPSGPSSFTFCPEGSSGKMGRMVTLSLTGHVSTSSVVCE